MHEPRCEKTSQLVIWYRQFLDNGKSAAFLSCVATRYSTATLQRMTTSPDHEIRRAAVLALGMIGTPDSMTAISSCLRDRDRCVRLVAELAFAELAKRQMGVAGSRMIDEVRRHIDGHRYGRAAAMLEEVTRVWPDFADAWYQCAVVSFCLGQYGRASRFASFAVELNKHHFPSYALEARCWMELEQFDKALKAFEQSYQINPSQLSVKGYIDTLRRQLRLNDSA